MELGFLYAMMMKRVKTTAIIEVVHNIFTSLYVVFYILHHILSIFTYIGLFVYSR
jgi:hypothetical protein